jgi:hypothetical protein
LRFARSTGKVLAMKWSLWLLACIFCLVAGLLAGWLAAAVFGLS